MIAVDVAHWHGALGGTVAWIYRNTPGNLAASAIAFTAGYLVKGRSIVKGLHGRIDELHRRHDHLETQVKQTHDIQLRNMAELKDSIHFPEGSDSSPTK